MTSGCHAAPGVRVLSTKSRAYHWGDKGLVEAKNGAVVRKHIGFGYIDAKHAEWVDRFHLEHLNLHRPSAVPKVLTIARRVHGGHGKIAVASRPTPAFTLPVMCWIGVGGGDSASPARSHWRLGTKKPACRQVQCRQTVPRRRLGSASRAQDT